MTPPDPNPTAPATLFGGEHITVRFRDPALPARAVFVRELKPSELTLALACYHSMTEYVEFICGEAPGFADSLAPASLFALHDKAEELNRPTFGPWLERQGPILKFLAGGSRSGASASAPASPSGKTPAGSGTT